VPVRHGNNGPTLVLRPVCEHAECLHAVLPHSRRGTDDVTSLVATRDGHRHAGVDGSHVSTVPLRTLAERSGRVLAALTQALTYGDEGEQTMHESSISTAVDALLTALPPDAQASIQRLSDLHTALRKPLRWVQVVAHRQRLGRGAVDALSHMWLCKLHANETELAQLRKRQQQLVEAVSLSVEWSWHDGQCLRAFDRLCTATLEHAFRTKRTEVELHCSDHAQTVQFLPSGMVVKESGAHVVRVSLKTYVHRLSVCTSAMLYMGGWVTVAGVSNLSILRACVCRHPFPPHWHAPSLDNYSSVELPSGTEFEQVQRRFHASLPRGTMELLSVTRCVVAHLLAPAVHAGFLCYTLWVLCGTESRTGTSGSVTNSDVT